MTLVTGTTIGDAVANAINGLNPMTPGNLVTLKSYWEPIAQALMAQGAGGFTSYNIVTASLSHGVQGSIAHGMPSAPTLALVLGVDNGQFVQGSPVLADLGSGNVGVTVQYGLSEQFAFVQATGTQALTSAIDSVVTYNATPVEIVGSNITFDGSGTLTFVKAGRYQLFGNVEITHAAAAAAMGCWIVAGGARQAMAVNSAPTTDNWWGNVSSIYKAAANDTATLHAYQNSGGSLNTATVSTPSFLQARQIANASSLSANVTLMLLKQ